MSIRAQVTISYVPLGEKQIMVEILDGEKGTFNSYGISTDDAEYQLLAQAIDRFATVAEDRRKLAHTKRDAELVEAALNARINANQNNK